MRRSTLAALATLLLVACAAKPAPAPVEANTPPPPLVQVCQDTLPLPRRTVGALITLLRRINSKLTVELLPCHAGTSWPVAYAAGESGQAPVGFAVLSMSGDALLIFDAADREAPTVELCNEVAIHLDEQHQVRAIALWESGADDKAVDPKNPDVSKATLAWVEVLAKDPSGCALGQRELAGQTGDTDLAEPVRCALLPLVLADRQGCDGKPVVAGAATVSDGGAADGGAAPVAAAGGKKPSAAEVEHALAGTHRFAGEGRTASSFTGLKLERPERCVYEPPPAQRDLCLAEYSDEQGNHFYGRGDVTRTGENGQKNYVDSYLTFQMLKRIEAERKKSGPGGTAPAKN